mmetsp:Transcript_31226/g.101681  ORF Transcript_31226/g.101681 Transcript_31226/m.101681 type:complete len:416 (+) Transcript_31226:382-1629(+)
MAQALSTGTAGSLSPVCGRKGPRDPPRCRVAARCLDWLSLVRLQPRHRDGRGRPRAAWLALPRVGSWRRSRCCRGRLQRLERRHARVRKGRIWSPPLVHSGQGRRLCSNPTCLPHQDRPHHPRRPSPAPHPRLDSSHGPGQGRTRAPRPVLEPAAGRPARVDPPAPRTRELGGAARGRAAVGGGGQGGDQGAHRRRAGGARPGAQPRRGPVGPRRSLLHAPAPALPRSRPAAGWAQDLRGPRGHGIRGGARGVVQGVRAGRAAAGEGARLRLCAADGGVGARLLRLLRLPRDQLLRGGAPLWLARGLQVPGGHCARHGPARHHRPHPQPRVQERGRRAQPAGRVRLALLPRGRARRAQALGQPALQLRQVRGASLPPLQCALLRGGVPRGRLPLRRGHQHALPPSRSGIRLQRTL